jgi:hypothetical protein
MTTTPTRDGSEAPPGDAARDRAEIRRTLIITWTIWGVLALVMAGYGLATGFERDATGDQAWAVARWFEGVELYATERLGYYYPPQSLLLFAPFGLAGDAGSAAWRVVTVLAFGLGVWGLVRHRGGTVATDLFLVASLVSIPPMLDATRNGQATVVMTAGMALCAAALARERWWWAAVWIGLAVALKPLAIVMLLLVGALYPRRMLWRLGVVGLALALMPFLTQSPGYVLEQYRSMAGKWVGSYGSDGTRAEDFGTHAELFSLLHVVGVEVSDRVQTGLRLVFAAGTLGLGWVARRRLGGPEAAGAVFALAAVYLMLFNPLNENNTYAVLAPALGVAAAGLLIAERRPVAGGLVALASVLIAANFELTKFVTPDNPVWLAPLVTIPFGLLVGWRACGLGAGPGAPASGRRAEVRPRTPPARRRRRG